MASIIMTNMVLAGGYYSWAELVEIFLDTIDKDGQIRETSGD